MIDAANIVDSMSPIGDKVIPETESQARELVGLTAQQAGLVMRVAHERAGGNLTAAAIRDARKQPWTQAEITTAIDGYGIHPYTALFPEFTSDEWQRLSTSIAEGGLYQPILLSPDGTINLDGRFRYLALKWLGIDPSAATTVFGGPALQQLDPSVPPRDNFDDEDELIVAVVYALNCLRKIYTPEELAAIEAEIAVEAANA
jgi:hypothetical protein